MNPCLLSIIIVNYNVKELLVKCLESILQNKVQNAEIILVDNNSSDNSVSVVREKFPEVKIIANQFNAGFPSANNQGFKISSGKYIFMLNPDAEITGNAINKLILYLDSHPHVALVAPKLLNTDGSDQLSIWRFPNIKFIVAEMFYLHKLIKEKFYLEKDFNTAFEIDSAAGAALMFRREMFSSIGMLDENLFWIEDVDFCYRIKKAGMKIMYYPEAKIIHHIGQSAKKNYIVSVSNMIFNKIKFYKKHHSKAETKILILISFFYSILKFLAFLVVSPLSKIYFRKAQAYWFTIPRVFNPPAAVK